jgi:hypothetical protein
VLAANAPFRSRGAFGVRGLRHLDPLERRGRREDRVAAAPGGSRAKEICASAREPQVQAGSARPSLRDGLRLIRALPGEPAFATVISRALTPRENLAPAWARQDHTISPSAKRAARQPAPSRPLHPRLTFRDDRDTPLSNRGGMNEPYTKSEFRKTEIFLGARLDWNSRRLPVGQIRSVWNAA